MTNSLQIQVYRAALAGDFAPAASALDHAPSDDLGRAKHFLLNACWWFTDESRSAPAISDAVALSNADVETRALVIEACIFPIWAAVLDNDPQTLQQWSDTAASLGKDAPAGTPAALWTRCCSAWRAIFASETIGEMTTERAQASEIGDPVLVLLLASLRALEALRLNQIDEAIALARRSSRMAASEEFPQLEYLCNWVLARVRRASSRNHAAARILDALLSTAQPRWRPVLLWELAMSGHHAMVSKHLPEDDGDWPAEILAKAITAAETGNRAELDAAATRLASLTWALSFHATEAKALLDGLDPLREPQMLSPEVAAWCTDQTDEVPIALRGFVPPPRVLRDWGVAGALVYVTPQGLHRRALLNGAPLLPEAAFEIAGSARGHGRVEHALCILARQNGQSISVSDLFEHVYGFELSSRPHEDAFTTLMARVRAALDDAGEVRAGDRERTLQLKQPLIIPDPRCEQSKDNLVLQLVAQVGRVSAAQASRILGIPVRTTQAALKALAEEGACRIIREGRNIEYVVEDTTFHVPTMVD